MRGRFDRRLARRGGVVELLRVPAALFGSLARLRSALYRRRVLPAYRVDTPVISVGNLSAGGTGKTPACVWVVQALQALGLRPGLLSRGYGRGDQSVNDEGLLLERLLPGVPHVQDPDRVAGARRLEEQGVDAIVLDDGFQHRRLVRDLDLVLVDATRPWGLAAPVEGGEPVKAMLPRGLLREPPSALARATALMITRSDAVSPERLEALTAELRALAPGCPLALARHAPVALFSFEEDRLLPRDIGELDGSEVDLLSAIGNPEAFETTVAGLGATVASHRAFPDHHVYQASDLEGLGSRPVVTTAKDVVKLDGVKLPLLVLDVALEIVEGESMLQKLLEELPESARARERAALHEGLHG